MDKEAVLAKLDQLITSEQAVLDNYYEKLPNTKIVQLDRQVLSTLLEAILAHFDQSLEDFLKLPVPEREALAKTIRTHISDLVKSLIYQVADGQAENYLAFPNSGSSNYIMWELLVYSSSN